MQEQRSHVRRLLEAEAAIADGAGKDWREVQLLDISRVGVAFASGEQLESGSTHMLNFYLPGNPRRNEVVVKIVHNSATGMDSGYRVGARFIAIDDDSTAIVSQFVGS